MSNRSLLEFNHDHWHRIKTSSQAFVDALMRYSASASKENAAALEPFGIRVFGMRHHSEGFDIQWGYHKASETASKP